MIIVPEMSRFEDIPEAPSAHLKQRDVSLVGWTGAAWRH